MTLLGCSIDRHHPMPVNGLLVRFAPRLSDALQDACQRKMVGENAKKIAVSRVWPACAASQTGLGAANGTVAVPLSGGRFPKSG